MGHEYVFVDLETTGLDAGSCQIIEAAAIAWQDGEEIERYSTLINPGHSIPAHITQLTGISNEMVSSSPPLSFVRHRLRRVIGDRIIVGHNVDFDIGFLKATDLAYGNHKIDTLTLASILLPQAGRFNLEHLTHYLDLPPTHAHRAEADAQHALNLYIKLHHAAAESDINILEEIVAAGKRIGWPETLFFDEVLSAQVRTALLRSERYSRLQMPYSPTEPEGKVLSPPDRDEPQKLQPIDVEMVKDMFRPGSNLSRTFPNFESREQQVEMVAAVATALNKQQHLLVEAGTGTGKSLAYLVPAAFWAQQNDRRVVISTNTINLQDQLLHKDIPQLQRTLPFEVRVAVRKGKGNYLCARLFQQLRHSGPRNKDEMALFARLLLWLPQTESADIGEITLRSSGERIAWRRISGENAPCTRQECSQQRCPLHYARRRAEQAHIVIVNHALLLADVANQNTVLPEFADLIIDEAHHFEDAVTNGLSFSADQRYLATLLEDLLKAKQGALGKLEEELDGLTASQQEKLRSKIARVREDARNADLRLQELFETLQYFVNKFIYGSSQFSQSVRLVENVRASAEFGLVRDSWQNLHLPLARIAKSMGELAKGIGELSMMGADIVDADDLMVALAQSARDLDELRANIDVIIDKPSETMITWVEQWRDRLSLHAAPLHVGPLVEEHIFARLDSVVMTSATMRTAPKGRGREASFDYLRARLNADAVDELAVGSPFDYQKSTLLYLCSDIPEPKHPGYQQAVEKAIVDIATTLGGRTLVLFTSYRQLRETVGAVQAQLADHDIATLAQLEGISRQQLTRQFKRTDARAVLFGTRSFWEGVDIPGPALECVVIVKLPFDVPSDPVIGARSETFDNAFMEYTVPEAVLRFRQGFGRLIRRKSDEGIVVVLDKRVLTKRYGELFLASLPNCTMLRQRTARLAEIIVRWQKRARE